MELKIFRTLIKHDHKLGGNEYVLGRISGIMMVMCGVKLHRGFDNTLLDDGWCFKCLCTEEKYEAFVYMIEDMYPGLCIFEYKGE